MPALCPLLFPVDFSALHHCDSSRLKTFPELITKGAAIWPHLLRHQRFRKLEYRSRPAVAYLRNRLFPRSATSSLREFFRQKGLISGVFVGQDQDFAYQVSQYIMPMNIVGSGPACL